MKLTKAIEILEDLDTTLPQFPPEMRREAVKLGTEALKRCKAYREAHIGLHYTPMPGETEE